MLRVNRSACASKRKGGIVLDFWVEFVEPGREFRMKSE
jgi:hypothetical protein